MARRNIRTSPTSQFKFVDYAKNWVLHPLDFVAFGSAEAGIVAKCTNNGGEYEVTFKYYLLDYYDWDVGIWWKSI